MVKDNPIYSPADFKTFILNPDFRSSIKHILIIRPGAIGDVIVTLPTIGAIRKHFHNARIEIMGYTSFLEITNGRFYADKVSRFDQADVAALFVKNYEMPVHLTRRFNVFDIVISFVSDKEQIFTENLKNAGARHVINYNPFPCDKERIHIVDHFLKLLDLLNIPRLNNFPKIFLCDEEIRFGDKYIKDNIANLKKMLVAIHPGSGSRQKCWPVERFAELITRLNDEMDAQIFIVSGPADSEIVESLKTLVKRRIIVADQFPLPKLAAVIKRCNLFIGNDSGIMHLTAAVGTPTIGIFGATDPEVWAPRGEHVKILFNKVRCSPCVQDVRRNCFSQICMGNITVENVIHEIKNVYRY